MLKLKSKPLLFILIFMSLSFALGFIGILSGGSPKEVEEYFQHVGLPYFPWHIIVFQIISWAVIFCIPGYFFTSAFWPNLALPEKGILVLLWGLVIASLSPAFLIPTLGIKIFTAYQYAFDFLFALFALIVSIIIWIIKR